MTYLSMAYLIRRTSIRSLAITPVLAIVLGLGLLSLHARTLPAQAQVADPGRAAVVLAFPTPNPVRG